MPKNKYGDIAKYTEGVKKERTENSTSEEVEIENDTLDNHEKKPPEIKKEPNPNETGTETAAESAHIYERRSVKKTVEIKLVYDVAIEALKSRRKKRSRFQNIEKPLTTNGIMNEILGEFFGREENKQYIEEAISELSEG